ncbi:uncharacterized protein EI90DRAFT_3015870 [Cantharellus anzutake]|uniref:uncharacterized protein n=1 Tax=Cantharellus anzutake TaxID=1750568 RepID=UPI0019032209|nr:uncharacterized protein EI90DRAFT_3015870 [Cantharellus anzutake]KAF8332245.1 hypothetical protein EI90DRAFT_3015870 [Cantharellus anzutake]
MSQQQCTESFVEPATLSKNQRKELVRTSFNKRILELRKSFDAQVHAIAQEFVRHGSRYSANQIRKQVVYKFSAPKKVRKPMLPNAWAHAKAQAHRKQEKALPNLPYSKEYLELLDDINNEEVTFDDIKNPLTPMDEHHARVALEGVVVKRENRALKENIISPELSAQRMAIHARDQLVQIAENVNRACGIQVMIMMAKGSSDDLFAPVMWASEKAKEYWLGVAKEPLWLHARLMEGYCIGATSNVVKVHKALSGSLRFQLAEWTRTELRKVTGKTQLPMEWVPRNYLKLTIRHGVKIDMTHYPGGKIVEPKRAVVNHLREAVKGWEDGKIKWVKLTAEEIEQQKAELSTLESEAAQAQTGDRSKSQATPNSSVRNSVAAGESSTSMGDNVSPARPSGLNTDNATPASSATHTGTEPAATTEVSSSSSRGTNSRKKCKAPADPKPRKSRRQSTFPGNERAGG